MDTVKGPRVAFLDSLVDVVFLGSVVFVAGSVFTSEALESGWAWVGFAGHWIPLFISWWSLEGFVNRCGRSSTWLPLLYFIFCSCCLGCALSFQKCLMLGFSPSNVPLNCFGFATFIAFSRLILFPGWLVVALSSSSQTRSFPSFRALSTSLTAALYFSCAFLDVNWLAFPVMWFSVIALDLLLCFFPSSFVWTDMRWRRASHSLESRLGTLHALALVQLCLTSLWSSSSSSSSWTSLHDVLPLRSYALVSLLLVLTFTLACWLFLASDASSSSSSSSLLLSSSSSSPPSPHSSHTHATQSHRWVLRSLYSTSMAIVTSSLTLLPILSKKSLSSSHLPFPRLPYASLLALFLISSASSQFCHTPISSESRLLPRWARMLCRVAAACVVLGISFVSTSDLDDVSWLGLVVAILSLALALELIGRTKHKRGQVFSFPSNSDSETETDSWNGAFSYVPVDEVSQKNK